MTARLRVAAPLAALLVAAAFSCAVPRGDQRPATSFASAAADLELLIRHEMADKDLPGLTIAVLQGEEVVWAKGFGRGFADGATSSAAAKFDAGTVARVGSVSKLFVDIALMQLAAEEKLTLDDPVSVHVPSFAPRNPYPTAITVRHLMTHHSGLLREPPVGHYFDADPRTLRETVASLNRTQLVHEPGTRFKYSNAGLAVAGLVVERASGEPFAEYVQRRIIKPLGLGATGFEPTPAMLGRLAKGEMWTLDGRRSEAPDLRLGMQPAADLYSTAVDMAHFTRLWFTRLWATDTGVLGTDAVQSMYVPQFGNDRIGLGFFLGELDGYLRVGHGGAMYGFATEVAALPEEGFGVAVIANVDFAGAVPERIANRALRWLVALREGHELDVASLPQPVRPDKAQELVGLYGDDDVVARVFVEDGELWIDPPEGFRERVRVKGEHLVTDDRIRAGRRVELDEDGLAWRNHFLTRIPDERPAPPPERWRPLIGEYGWDHNVLYVRERHGKLGILIEWFAGYPLIEDKPDAFRIADRGLYASEPVTFEKDEVGRATAVTVGGVRFPRRTSIDTSDTFRITPLMTEAVLRSKALAAEPPKEPGPFLRPDLVPVTDIDDTVQLDVRYASKNNFMGMVFYPRPVALMQRPAAEALVRVHRGLAEQGFGLRVFDAYRPWYVTKMFFDATPATMKHFVADPDKGSRHNRGCAADVTLFERDTGNPVSMTSGYDEFTPRAYPRYPGGTSRQRWHRRLLHDAMSTEGFTVYEWEWWHYDFPGWEQYPILKSHFH